MLRDFVSHQQWEASPRRLAMVIERTTHEVTDVLYGLLLRQSKKSSEIGMLRHFLG